MSGITEIIHELAETAAHPKASIVKAMKDTGKKALGCFPIYTPEEIAYAAGYLPVGLWGGQTDIKLADKYIQGFCCSIMRANMELAMRGSYSVLEGVVIPTYCDSLKAILANWMFAVPNVKVIAYSVIQNRYGSGALAFAVAQLEIFRKDVEALCGKTIADSDIEKAFALYEAYRAAMRVFTERARKLPRTVTPTLRHQIIKAAFYMDKKDYLQKIAALNDLLAGLPEEKAAGPKVIVTGLLAEPASFLDLFTENGFAFMGDDLAQESRQFRTPARSEGSAVERMAYRLLDQRGDTFFYEKDKSRGKMLVDMARETGADGVVVAMFKFCDPEEFDYPVYKKELDAAGIPILYLEIEQKNENPEALRTRIQSFAEMRLGKLA
jgi:benzoyl-CoA reductase/2-hydroxyglutaryl-CoA dehydratase subunit BcrC/BadD/HgdB